MLIAQLPSPHIIHCLVYCLMSLILVALLSLLCYWFIHIIFDPKWSQFFHVSMKNNLCTFYFMTTILHHPFKLKGNQWSEHRWKYWLLSLAIFNWSFCLTSNLSNVKGLHDPLTSNESRASKWPQGHHTLLKLDIPSQWLEFIQMYTSCQITDYANILFSNSTDGETFSRLIPNSNNFGIYPPQTIFSHWWFNKAFFRQ